MRISLSFLAVTLAVAGATRAAADPAPPQLRPSVYEDVTSLISTDEPVAAPVRRRTTTEDPYDPLGITAGGFTLFPSLTIGLGASTNVSNSAGGVAGGFWSVAPALDILSNWDTNSASVVLRGAYQDYFDNVAAAQPTGSADANLRFDLPERWSLALRAGASYTEQSLSDPNYPAGAERPPGVIGLNTSAALSGNLGRFQLTFAGGANRTIYEDAMSTGGPIDQSDRTNTLYSGRLRLGYEINSWLTPFVETEIGRRIYDQPIDDENVRRAGTSYALRAGIAVDRDPVLKGEIAVGAIRETFDDPTLAELRAVTVDGSLTWSPRRLVTITLAGNTALNPTTDISSSGSVLYSGSVDVAYAWRRNVTVDWISGISNEDYQGTGETDTTYRTGLSATWKVNRDLQMVASYAHQWLVSTNPSLPYQSDTVQAELRLLR
jgi:hypothetical protein